MRAPQVSCSFSGHRPEKLPWGNDENDPRCKLLKKQIWQQLQKAYSDGYRHFLCGMALGCDIYFCQLVLALQHMMPDVTLEAAVPCADQCSTWDEEEQQRYYRLLEKCSERTVLQEQYSPGCMQRRNRYMVEHSHRLIAVHNGMSGGTYNTMLYAMSLQKELVVVPVPTEVPAKEKE